MIWDCNWTPCKDDLREPFCPIMYPNMSVKELWDHNKRWEESKVKNYFNNKRDVEETLKI